MGISVHDFSGALADVVAQVGRSVVRVEGHRRGPVTGVVWAPNRVVTVAAGVGDAVVVSQGQDSFKASVKGVDSSTGLVLLAVEGLAAPPASFDDGAALRVGELVLRLGRPGQTVRASSGIISAVGPAPFRAAGGGEIERWLETDAQHQPGFSGGPVVTTSGQSVGLTSTSLVRHASLIVPTRTVRRVVEQLEAHGRIRSSYLGAKLQPVQLPDGVRAQTQEEVGLLVLSVEDGSPAAKAGLNDGDTLLHLGDASVKTLEDLYAFLRVDRSGQTWPARVFRRGAVEQLQVTLGAR